MSNIVQINYVGIKIEVKTHVALFPPYEHIVIQIKTYYEYNILQIIAKMIIKLLKRILANLHGRLRVCT